MGHGVSKAASDAGKWIKGAWGTAKKFAVSAEPYVRNVVNTASKFAPQIAQEFPEAGAAIMGADALLNSDDKYTTAAQLASQYKPKYADTFTKMGKYAKMGRDAYTDYSANKPVRPGSVNAELSRIQAQSTRQRLDMVGGNRREGPNRKSLVRGVPPIQDIHNPTNQGLWGGGYN